MRNTCSIDDCFKFVVGNDYCMMHYKRWRRYNDPLVKRAPSDPLFRFWESVTIGKSDECWQWQGGTFQTGYGVFHPGKRVTTTAHRWIYQKIKGALPDDLYVDHICHNDTNCKGGSTCEHRCCVNPNHLEAVTNSENLKRSQNVNENKTHCVRGHEYSGENIYRTPSKPNSRKCRACARVLDKKRRSRKEMKI